MLFLPDDGAKSGLRRNSAGFADIVRERSYFLRVLLDSDGSNSFRIAGAFSKHVAASMEMQHSSISCCCNWAFSRQIRYPSFSFLWAFTVQIRELYICIIDTSMVINSCRGRLVFGMPLQLGWGDPKPVASILRFD